MTSVLNVDSIAAKDGTSPVELTKQQAVRLWVIFNVTGTIAARDSLNLSSLADNGTGQYGINYASAWSAVTYAFTGTMGQDTATSRTTGGMMFDDQGSTPTTTAHRTVSRNKGNASNVDCANIHCLVVGDLA